MTLLQSSDDCSTQPNGHFPPLIEVYEMYHSEAPVTRLNAKRPLSYIFGEALPNQVQALKRAEKVLLTVCGGAHQTGGEEITER